MKIANGRTHFYQWDLNQQLEISFPCGVVYFENGTQSESLGCEVKDVDGKLLCDVPNILLQTAASLHAYAWDAEKTYVIAHMVFVVEQRERPADYVYTPTEVWTAEKAVAKALQAAKESGAFKGEKGDKGDAGVVEFIVVSELPNTDIKNAIYLMADDNAEEGNLFGEYVYINGAWERVGSAGVEIDLNEYVKNTDYGSQTTAGLCKGFVACGTYVGEGGAICIQGATLDEISSKNQAYKPITPSTIDHAIKVGLITNTLTLTPAEKRAVREWLGAAGRGEYGVIYQWPDSTTAGDYMGQIFLLDQDARGAITDVFMYCDIDPNGEHVWHRLGPAYNGYTPQKGVDYYTPADKEEMVQAVIAALPTYNGEVDAV